MLQKDTETRDRLTELLPVFERLTTEAIEIIFQQRCEFREQWSVSERPEGTFDHIVVIGNSNNDYQASFITGIQKDAVTPFFGYEIETEEATDAFAEFGNTFCGMLMDDSEFNKTFGILLNSVPMIYEDKVFLPRASTVGGKLYFEDHWVYCAYAIRKLAFMSISPSK